MRKLLFFAVLFLVGCTQVDTEEKKEKINAVFAIGTEENPLARMEYDQLRYASPLVGKIPANMTQMEYAFVQSMPKSINSDFDWFWRGPQNQGGRTRALALDILDETRILAGAVSGGLWISENGGESFEKAHTSLMSHSITCISQDKRAGFENIWYYGTGEQSGNSSDLVGHGIYKSVDNGWTWTILEATLPDSAQTISSQGDFNYVRDLVVNPTNGEIVAATFAGIFRSNDGGDTWQNELVIDGDPNGFGYVNFGNLANIDVTSDGVYYATLSRDGSDRGIWRSTDGDTWIDITPTGFASSYRRIESGIAPGDENQVYFIVDAQTNPLLDEVHQLWKYKYISGDGTGAGGVWTDKTANLPSGTCTGFYDFDFGYYQSQGGYDMYIKVHPTDTNIVFLGGTNIYRSTNGFSINDAEWIGGYQCDAATPSNYIWPNHHPDQHVAIFLPSNPNVMLSAHDGGLSKINDCLSTDIEWQSMNNGYGTTQFYTVAIEQGEAESEQIVGGLQDNGTFLTNTINALQDWNMVFYGDGAYCAIDEGRNNYYLSWQGGKTFKFSIDEDNNVDGLTRIDPIGGSDYMFINPFILDPTDNNTMYLAGGQYIWKNDSLADIPLVGEEYNALSMGWTRIDESDVSSVFGADPRISALDMSVSTDTVLYYTSESGGVYKLIGLDTENYQRINLRDNSIMPSGAFPSCIEVNPENADEVLLTFSNYEVESIFYTVDGGDNWEDVSGNLEENSDGTGAGPSANWAHFYTKDGETTYFVGTTSGLFSTETLQSDMTVWAREGVETIGNVPVAMIVSRPYDNNIVVATHGNGMYSTKQFISNVNDINLVENGFYMGNPFPNPASDKVKMEYRIDESADVSIKVIDVFGREVATLVEGTVKAGTYEARWYPQNATGNYFIVMDVDGQKQSRKVIVAQ
ncbi:MAG: T9SS type A sorting domain-containing protein [Chitinophagales bacterium]